MQKSWKSLKKKFAMMHDGIKKKKKKKELYEEETQISAWSIGSRF